MSAQGTEIEQLVVELRLLREALAMPLKLQEVERRRTVAKLLNDFSDLCAFALKDLDSKRERLAPVDVQALNRLREWKQWSVEREMLSLLGRHYGEGWDR